MNAHRVHVLALVAIALGGCNRVEVTTIPSPDGWLVAKLLDDRGGGPATSAYQKVVVEHAEPFSNQKAVIFEGANTGGRGYGDLNVWWLDNETIRIGLCDASDYSVVKAASVAGHPIRVEFVQEQRGAYPASIPVERRGLGPPCV